MSDLSINKTTNPTKNDIVGKQPVSLFSVCCVCLYGNRTVKVLPAPSVLSTETELPVS